MTNQSEKTQKWDKYQKAYNDLSDVLIKSGIDYKLLRQVIDFHEEYMNCYQSYYQSGV